MAWCWWRRYVSAYLWYDLSICCPARAELDRDIKLATEYLYLHSPAQSPADLWGMFDYALTLHIYTFIGLWVLQQISLINKGIWSVTISECEWLEALSNIACRSGHLLPTLNIIYGAATLGRDQAGLSVTVARDNRETVGLFVWSQIDSPSVVCTIVRQNDVSIQAGRSCSNAKEAMSFNVFFLGLTHMF